MRTIKKNYFLYEQQQDPEMDDSKRYSHLTSIGTSAFKGCSNLEEMILPDCIEKVSSNAFGKCWKLKNGNNGDVFFNARTIHYLCDVNRGGGKYLRRDHHHHHHYRTSDEDDDEDDSDGKDSDSDKMRSYPSSLWPLIIYRAFHEMEYPKIDIFGDEQQDDDEDDDRGDAVDDDDYIQTKSTRCVSVVYYLMYNGIIMDLR